MHSLIVRIYATDERARDAVAKLKAAGFRDDAILAVTPGAPSVGDAMVAGRMLGHRAEFYAERVKQGRSIVAVDAPFGRGQAATGILDGCEPVDLDLELPEDPVAVRGGRAAPLSAALGWTVLSRKNPTPLSDALGLRTTARSEFYLTSELASPDYALSESMGMRLLSRSAAPFSSKLGLPVLSRKQPRAKLLNEPSPLSSALGMATLSRNPAPLSSLLGWATLTRHG